MAGPSSFDELGEFCGQLGALVAQLATRAGLSEAKAEGLALDAMNQLRQQFGGRDIYVRKQSEPPGELGAELYARLNQGERVKDIAREIGKTAAYVYRLIAAERERLKLLRAQRK